MPLYGVVPTIVAMIGMPARLFANGNIIACTVPSSSSIVDEKGLLLLLRVVLSALSLFVPVTSSSYITVVLVIAIITVRTIIAIVILTIVDLYASVPFGMLFALAMVVPVITVAIAASCSSPRTSNGGERRRPTVYSNRVPHKQAQRNFFSLCRLITGQLRPSARSGGVTLTPDPSIINASSFRVFLCIPESPAPAPNSPLPVTQPRGPTRPVTVEEALQRGGKGVN